jgi:hypothetical protein
LLWWNINGRREGRKNERGEERREEDTEPPDPPPGKFSIVEFAFLPLESMVPELLNVVAMMCIAPPPVPPWRS